MSSKYVRTHQQYPLYLCISGLLLESKVAPTLQQ